MIRNSGLKTRLSIGLFVVGTCCSLFALSGCERKERVVDVKTPVGDVQVDKTVKPNGDTTGVEVKAPGVEINTKEK